MHGRLRRRAIATGLGSVLLVGCGGDDAGPGGADSGSSSGTATTTMTAGTATATAGTTAGTSASTSAGTSASTTAGTDTAGETTADASSSGEATTGVAPGDCSGALLCEDFEGYGVAQAPGGPWLTSTQQGTLAIDDSMAYSGSNSVHITIEGGDGSYRRAFMSIEGAPVFPAAAGEVWGRMMMNLVAWPPGAVHWTNIQGEGEVEGMGFRGLYRYGGMNDGAILANYETQGVGSDCWRNSQTIMPTGWTCLEWHFVQATDTMELYVDGQPIDDVAVVGQGDGCITHDTGDHWYAPAFDTMRLGWEHYQQTDGKELWIDDVAMDTARIGCPQ
ncbi:MAG: hypothetical protein K1X88_32365 [Nannocystaceae bacterium]|nr:hypothetical protein [Nannocystaceae bacterium]